jgi:hypothetical protein
MIDKDIVDVIFGEMMFHREDMDQMVRAPAHTCVINRVESGRPSLDRAFLDSDVSHRS